VSRAANFQSTALAARLLILRVVILFLAIPAGSAQAKGAPVCVNVGGTGGCFATIQAAVDSIHKSGTIMVGVGAFVENISIPSGKKIVVNGADPQLVGTTDIRQASVGTSAITIAGGGALTLTSLEVSASAAPMGGCILANGSLTLTSVFVLGCTANGGGSGNGGGIYFAGSGQLAIDNSVIENDIASGSGGGLYSAGATRITNTQFSGNSTTGAVGGGAVFRAGKIFLANTSFLNNFTTGTDGGGLSLSGGMLTGANLTFHHNIANGNGGNMMVAGGTASLNNCTLESGGAGGNGGGIDSNNPASVSISNTILAKNLVNGTGPDCSAGLTSKGFNLIESESGCTVGGNLTGIITGQDPLFTGITCLNGIVCVQEISNSSPAVGAGNPKKPSGKKGTCSKLDPLGTPRPTGTCDIGAFQVP
jgi:hypothetical protein